MASDVVLYLVNLSAFPHGDFILEVVRRAFLLASALAQATSAVAFWNHFLAISWPNISSRLGPRLRNRHCDRSADVVRCCFGRNCVRRTPFYFNYQRCPGRYDQVSRRHGSTLCSCCARGRSNVQRLPLQTLSRAHLAWLGVLLTSVPFALIHLWNPHVVRGVTFTNTALAGVWLALAYLRTRSLWLPLGIHWSWNWALGSIFGLR
jgi:hypothetical protein